MKKHTLIFLWVVLPIFSSLNAQVTPFPCAYLQVPDMSPTHKFAAGLNLVDGFSQFQAVAYYGLLDKLDLGVRLVPYMGDIDFNGGLALSSSVYWQIWKTNAFLLGGDASFSLPLGKVPSYHFEHGSVYHIPLGLSGALTMQWRFLYFGLGGVGFYDIQEKGPDTDMRDDEEIKYKPKNRKLSYVRPFMGLSFGKKYRIFIEFNLFGIDDTWGPKNALYEPSEAVFSSASTVGLGFLYTFGTHVQATEKKPADPQSDQTNTIPLIETRKIFKGSFYGGITATAGFGLGVLGGIYSVRFTDSDMGGWALLIYPIVGAFAGYPFGVPVGVCSVGKTKGEKGSLIWTIGGTLLGTGVGTLLAPVTAGLSYIVLIPMGATIGYNISARNHLHKTALIDRDITFQQTGLTMFTIDF